MALRLAPCTCTTIALIGFIRRVAHINIVLADCPTNLSSLSRARNYTSTFYPPQLHETSQDKTITNTSYQGIDANTSPKTSNTPKRKQWPFKPNVNIRSEGTWAVGSPTEKPCASLTRDSYNSIRQNIDESSISISRTAHDHENGSAILELTPEAIDVLAAESLEDNSHSSTSMGLPAWNARPNRSRASIKGFALRYNSSSIDPTPQARGLRKRVSKSLKSQIPYPRFGNQHRVLVAEREPWQIQKEALKEKFEVGWNPRKKLSPDALAGIRAIHAQFPEQYTTSVLAEKFEVSPEAIRRILKSRWAPKEEEVLDRQRRWFLRGQKVWSRYAELGLKPPKRWRRLGIGRRNVEMPAHEMRQSIDTKVTVRSANQAVLEPDETARASSVTMAERIL